MEVNIKYLILSGVIQVSFLEQKRLGRQSSHGASDPVCVSARSLVLLARARISN